MLEHWKQPMSATRCFGIMRRSKRTRKEEKRLGGRWRSRRAPLSITSFTFQIAANISLWLWRIWRWVILGRHDVQKHVKIAIIRSQWLPRFLNIFSIHTYRKICHPDINIEHWVLNCSLKYWFKSKVRWLSSMLWCSICKQSYAPACCKFAIDFYFCVFPI